MKLSLSTFLFVLILSMTCCSSKNDTSIANAFNEEEPSETNTGLAAVTNVTVSEEDGQFTFSVTIASPDLGCNQYANWWEIIDLDGNLIYRRILGHSHVNEQPFTRSGVATGVMNTTEIYIRAHMNTTGYGNVVFRGSVESGFSSTNLDSVFAENLDEVAPLPGNCVF
jgi:hypothetical protein